MPSTFFPFENLHGIPEPDWLVEGLLPLGYTAILASEPKAGKTCFATAIALAVANGLPFAGLRTAPGPVLWCCMEESASERMAVLGHWDGTQQFPEIYTSFEPIRIDTEEGICFLTDAIRDVDAKLVVIDPLYAAIGGYSLGEANLARRSLTRFKNMCAVQKVTGLVLHHLVKSGPWNNVHARVAESAQLSATASMQMLLTHHPYNASKLPTASPLEARPSSVSHHSPLPVPLPSQGRLVCLDCKGRGQSINRKWRFISHGLLDYRTADPEAMPARVSPKAQAILDAIASGVTTADGIIQATHLRGTTVYNHLRSLLTNGEIRLARIDGLTRHYSLP